MFLMMMRVVVVEWVVFNHNHNHVIKIGQKSGIFAAVVSVSISAVVVFVTTFVVVVVDFINDNNKRQRIG